MRVFFRPPCMPITVSGAAEAGRAQQAHSRQYCRPCRVWAAAGRYVMRIIDNVKRGNDSMLHGIAGASRRFWRRGPTMKMLRRIITLLVMLSLPSLAKDGSSLAVAVSDLAPQGVESNEAVIISE
jgi:hypothetical protein